MPQSGRRRESAPTIASTSNEQVRFVKALYRTSVREQERLFVVEGVRLLEDALNVGARPVLVLVARDQLGRTARGTALLERVTRFRSLDVTEAVLESIADTVTPQGVIAVFPIPGPPDGLAVGPIVLVLDRVRDPGNAGTILRSADASGVTRTVALVDSVDAYSPKVVRAGMGAHFRLTILDNMTWDHLLPRLGAKPRYLAVASGGQAYDRMNWSGDCVLIVGGEAEGAGPEAMSAAAERVTIPMIGRSESLNAAMSATILLFDAARTRRDRTAATPPVQVAAVVPPVSAASTGRGPRPEKPRLSEPRSRSKRPRPGPKPGGAPPTRSNRPRPKS